MCLPWKTRVTRIDEGALHIAVNRDFVQGAIFLIRYGGANVEARDNYYGRTALHLAAWKDSVDVAKELIQGANVEAKDSCYGEQPLHKAARNYSLDVAKELIRSGAKKNTRNRSGRKPIDRLCHISR